MYPYRTIVITSSTVGEFFMILSVIFDSVLIGKKSIKWHEASILNHNFFHILRQLNNYFGFLNCK